MYFLYSFNTLTILSDTNLVDVYMAKFTVFKTNNVWTAGCRHKWACKEKHWRSVWECLVCTLVSVDIYIHVELILKLFFIQTALRGSWSSMLYNFLEMESENLSILLERHTNNVSKWWHEKILKLVCIENSILE